VLNRAVLLIAASVFVTRLSVTAQAGLINTAYYSVDDGLSSREVRDIFQDDQGFIWLGTANGINRFDGYTFENFDNLPNTAFQISDDDIAQIGQTNRNELFIQYNNNPVFFDLLDLDTYETTKVQMLPNTGVKGFVQHIHLTPDGEIYALALNQEGIGIYHYQRENDFQLIVQLPESHEKKISPMAFVLTPKGDFLINDSEHGLKLVSRTSAVKQVFSSESFGLSDQTEVQYPADVQIFHQDRSGRVWISFDKTPGLFLLTPAKDSCYQIAMPDFAPQPKFYTQLWEDKQGNLLMAATDHSSSITGIETLLCLKPDGSSMDFSHVISPRQQTTALYSANFFGTIFFGLDTGLKMVQNNLSTVQTFLDEDIPLEQRGAIMRAIVGNDKDRVYIAREQYGWYVLDLKTDFLDTLSIVDREGFPIPIDCSYSLHLDDDGYLWGFSCLDNGRGLLIQYDTAHCYAHTFTYNGQFTSLIPGEPGRLWLTAISADGQGELISFNKENGTFEKYRDKKGVNPLQAANPYYLHAGRSGYLNIGTNRGLFRLDPNTDSLFIFERDDGKMAATQGLQSDDILAIHEDESGKLWLGTTNGLSILEPATGAIQTLSKEDGLPNNIVCGILPDGHGAYWISTYNGLAFFSPEYNLFRKFYSTDGFSHNEFNRFSFYQDHRGRYYFGGVNGINAFYPRDLIVATSTPAPRLTQITRFSSRSDSIIVQKKGLRSLKKLVINPYDSYFQVHFMLPVYSRTDKNQFSAWLEGYEPGWVKLGATSFVRYNNLPAGDYTLHINGSDPNGNPSQTPILLEIEVHPKFYTTWPFLLMVALFLVGLGYGIFRFQLDQQLRVERLRTRLSSDIHDEVSGLLSGIAMQTDVLRELSQENYMEEKLKAIGETSRKAMSKMSDIIWSTDSRKDRMSDLVERMREHADDMLLRLNIPYDFRMERIDETRKIPVNIRQNLYFIYKEAVNNVAKHADASRVIIRLTNQGNSFQMIIHNNGHPRNHNRKKAGQGLSNMQMRAQRINANIDILNHDGFTVKVNMRKFT
jgi:ligand-binding sensor domain-containing protein/two-component sensor histidine kinase